LGVVGEEMAIDTKCTNKVMQWTGVQGENNWAKYRSLGNTIAKRDMRRDVAIY
jgi:hypothetical protein